MPQAKAKPAKQKPVEGLEPGDEVYCRHPTKGAVTVKVLAVGKHGFTADDEEGVRHKLHHDTYLGHKSRQLHEYRVVEEGADGFLAERADGQRRFLRGQLPKPEASENSGTQGAGQDNDPLLAGLDDIMAKALRPLPRLVPATLPADLGVFAKAGPLKNRPGLSLKDITDRTGRHSKHWVRTNKEQPHPREKKGEEPEGGDKPRAEAKKPTPTLHKHGDTVSFRHGDVEGHGKIVGSGVDGVTVQTEDGREHKVRHDAIEPPHQYAEKAENESDKDYLKRTAKDIPSPKHLPEEHERFFNMEGATTVPMDQIVSSKSDAENAKGGENAPKFMMAAYHGKVAKRDPVTVEKQADGKYKVLDGNGTFTGAKAAGWKALPVKVQEPTPAADPGPLFDQADMALPKSVAQPVKTREELEAKVPEAQKQLEDWLDKGKGAAIQAGFKHAEGGPVGKVLDEPGKLLFIAPPKSGKRAAEKVEADYGGDWSQLLDPVRCSLACDNFAEIKQALDVLKATGMKIARKPKDRFADPTPVGYRDVLLNVTLPNGVIGEVQLHLKSILKAKADGHKWYEIERTLRAKAETSDLSDDEQQKLLASVEAQKQIYGEAWKSANSSAPPADQPHDEEMKKALTPSGTPYTYWEKDNAHFRGMNRNGTKAGYASEVLHGDKWVPYKGDGLAPVHYGDEEDDPLGGDDGEGDGEPPHPAPGKPGLMKKALLFLKATIKGGAAHDLFQETVPVHGYTRNGRFVLPHTAKRAKRHDPQPSPHRLVTVADAKQQKAAPAKGAYAVFLADTIAGKFHIAVKRHPDALVGDDRSDAISVMRSNFGGGATLAQTPTYMDTLSEDFSEDKTAPGWGFVARAPKPAAAQQAKEIPGEGVSKAPMPNNGAVFDDLNSTDAAQLRTWLRAIPVNKAEVINDLAVRRESEVRYNVQGFKTFMGTDQVLSVLIKKGVPRSRR